MSGLSNQRIVFGIHSLSPYSRADHLPYGILKVIGSASMTMQAGVEILYGGAQKFAWAAESKTISSEISAKVKAYPGFLFSQFLGGTDTENTAEAGGSVSALSNVKGTSCKNATTGVASVSVLSGSEADVKFGKYVVKAVSATTVDVYLLSDVDIARGTDAVFQDDSLKITATALTIASAGDVNIPNTGLKLTGGSGTIGMTTGDTCVFSSRPINTGSADFSVGGSATSMAAFGAVILAQKRATGEMFEIEAWNCIPQGMPIPMDELKFSETELKAACVYDSAHDEVFHVRSVTPATFN